MIGVEKAVNLFDVRKGFKFSTYATWWIKQSLSRYIANSAETIRVPIHVQERIIKINRIYKKWEQKYRREPTVKEIITETDIKQLHVEEALEVRLISTGSLNEPLGDDSETEFGDLIANNEPDVGNAVSEGLDMKKAIETIFSTNHLTDRHKLVLSLRFCVYTPELERFPVNGSYGSYQSIFEAAMFKVGLPMEEIGNVLNLTRERIRLLESEALSVIGKVYPELSALLPSD
jgi:RNA polymerase primary sigma factor